MITMEHPKVTSEQFKALTAPLTEAETRDAAAHWLTFTHEWTNVANVAHEAGQDVVRDFLDEMADEAADFWVHLAGPQGV